MELQAAFGRTRPVCVSCGFVHFLDPKVAAAVIVIKDGNILLTRRAVTPRQGYWVTPGGYVDAGEDPVRAAVRECLEETGLQVEVVRLLDVIPNRQGEAGGGASFVIFYLAAIVGGALAPGDDADDVMFFAPDQLPELAFDSTREMLSKWIGRGETKA